jgi:CHASE3 domain sensor protein
MPKVRAEDDVRRAFAIQRDTYQVHALLAEAAAGVRGYALTGRRFLEPYRKAEAELPQTMARLDADDPRSRGARALQPDQRPDRAQARGAEAHRRPGRRSRRAAGQALPLIEQALVANKIVLDAMRQEIDLIQRREAVLLDQRRAGWTMCATASCC